MSESVISIPENFEFNLKLALDEILSDIESIDNNSLIIKDIGIYLSKSKWSKDDRKEILLLIVQWLIIPNLTAIITRCFRPLLVELFFIAHRNRPNHENLSSISQEEYSILVFSSFSKIAAISSLVKKNALIYYSEINIFESMEKFYPHIFYNDQHKLNSSLDACDIKCHELAIEFMRSCWRLIKCDIGSVIKPSFLLKNIYLCQNQLKVMKDNTSDHDLSKKKLFIQRIYILSLKCLSSLLSMNDWEVLNFDFNFDSYFEYMSLVDEEDSSQINLLTPEITYNNTASTVNENSMNNGYIITVSDLESGMDFIAGTLITCSKTKNAPLDNTDDLKHPHRKYNFSNTNKKFFITRTTFLNLQAFSLAVAKNNPVLLIGATASGKTSLILYFARRLGYNVTIIHVGCALDAKTLLGGYIMTDTPGNFKWADGVLTSSVKRGDWLIIEDYDMASPEITGILSPLIKSRQLFIPSRAEIVTAPCTFSLFATITSSATKSIDNLQYVNSFNKVFVDPLNKSELSEIIENCFDFGSTLSRMLVDFHFDVVSMEGSTPNFNERQLNLRDLFKWATRIHESIFSYSSSEYEYIIETLKSNKSISSGIRELIVIEAQDVYCSSIQNDEIVKKRLKALSNTFSLTQDRIEYFFYSSIPECELNENLIKIGRVVLDITTHHNDENTNPNSVFVQNTLSLKLLEKIAQSVKLNESILLVGETGCGKTTILQYLASSMKKKLHILNFSQSSDPTDFIGGFRPVDLEWISKPCYKIFEFLFIKTFSISKNQKLIKKVSKAFISKDYTSLIKIWNSVTEVAVSKFKKVRLEQNGNSESMDQSSCKFDIQAISSKILFNGDEEQNFRFFMNILEPLTLEQRWLIFKDKVSKFSIQVGGAKAFQYVDGELVRAMQLGNWILLDEINLALPDVLEYLSGILNDESLFLSERGDVEPIRRHPDFRIFAAMNPSGDFGKSQLPNNLRVRFTEYYLNDLSNVNDLAKIVDGYLNKVSSNPPIMQIVNLYFRCKNEMNTYLFDGTNQRPIFNLRTLSRALEYAVDTTNIYGFDRALYEGLNMAFLTQLNSESLILMVSLLTQFKKEALPNLKLNTLSNPPNKTFSSKIGGRNEFVNFEQFSIEKGPLNSFSDPTFIITPTVKKYLIQICRCLITRKYPILLQGSTSTGKTSMIEYLAKLTGNYFVRINNSDQTDIQEYIGQYTYDTDGKIVFQEGVFVNALRKGHWILLDELNLAPSEILEALNRLLDDNRQLYVPELQEMIKPHPNFCLFATQNPPGLYGGRKFLSRAFRSRFLEIYLDEIPDEEIEVILAKKSLLPTSFCKKIILIMKELQKQRQGSQVFAGKNLLTLRDLFKLTGRNICTYQELGINAYFLFADRLRDDEEKNAIRIILEKILKIQLDMEQIYHEYWANSFVDLQYKGNSSNRNLNLNEIVWTSSSKRLFALIHNSLKNKEPVLLIGPPGTGKTAISQFYSQVVSQKLQIINCHQSTDTSDFIGALRPIRGKENIFKFLIKSVTKVFFYWKKMSFLNPVPDINYDDPSNQDYIFTLLNDLYLKVDNLINMGNNLNSDEIDRNTLFYLNKSIEAYIENYKNYRCNFCWYDGPLVSSMKYGNIFLIDEISLAECSVLERLNSVLETGRTLVLSEKGGSEIEQISANPDFRIIATMNPGGDFGKKELSPALRNRFTEIYVPSICSRDDLIQIMISKLESQKIEFLAYMIADFVFYFEEKMRSVWEFTIRDILKWIEFIKCTWEKIGLIGSYLHGASMIIFDGLGMIQSLGIEELKKNAVMNLKNQVQFITDKILQYYKANDINMFSCPKLFIDTNIPSLNSNGESLIIPPSTNNVIEYPYNPSEICSLELFESPNIDIRLFSVSNGKFGIGPFSFSIKEDEKDQDFHLNTIPLSYSFNSPTVIKNLLRLLRALQLNKPILLEGSPGVGKTSLVEALAFSCRYKVFRINLSDQTDMMDFLGADLPTESSGNAEDPNFQWRDGVFLNALKSGDWILLDELNLANQSVLEGLNSVLDHRGEVYIPELSSTFKCPPSFRIFATQNPTIQGGGRKGLPKSFLNRFSKVYLDPMVDEDLIYISNYLYPQIGIDIIKKIVQFNSTISKNVEDMKFARQGYPWEFNLRDILKWCQLLVDSQHKEPVAFVELLYGQRLRTTEDRLEVMKISNSIFGEHLSYKSSPFYLLSSSHIQVGETYITRKWHIFNRDSFISDNSSLYSNEPILLESLLNPLKSLIYCINKKWLAILLGPTASGKTSLLRLISKLTGNRLVTFSMNPSIDTMEILGGFEQIDINRQSKMFLEKLHNFIMDMARILLYIHQTVKNYNFSSNEYLDNEKLFDNEFRIRKIPKNISILNQFSISSIDILIDEAFHLFSMWESFNQSIAKIGNTSIFSNNEQINFADSIISALESLDKKLNEFNYKDVVSCNEISISILELKRMLSNIKKLIINKVSGSFEWVDSLLIEALKNGYWIVIDNANTCPGPVLDRLLPLLEQDGKLSLPERGLIDGKVLDIYPHKNFRIFFTMDPKYGEISRAMRNRGLEISFLPYEIANNDTKCLLKQILKIYSNDLVNKMIEFHIKLNEVQVNLSTSNTFINNDLKDRSVLTSDFIPFNLSIRELLNWASLYVEQIERGCDGLSSLFFSMEQVYVRYHKSINIRQAINSLFDSIFRTKEFLVSHIENNRSESRVNMNLLPGFSRHNNNVTLSINSNDMHLSHYSEPYISLLDDKSFETSYKFERFASIQALTFLMNNSTEDQIVKSLIKLNNYLNFSLKSYSKEIFEYEDILLNWLKKIYNFSHENKYGKLSKNLYHNIFQLKSTILQNDNLKREHSFTEEETTFNSVYSTYPFLISYNTPHWNLLYKLSLSNDNTWSLFQQVYQSSQVLELYLETLSYKWLESLIMVKKISSLNYIWTRRPLKFPEDEGDLQLLSNPLEAYICDFFKKLEVLLDFLIENINLKLQKNESFKFSENSIITNTMDLNCINLELIIRMRYQLFLDIAIKNFNLSEFLFKWRYLVKFIIKFLSHYKESFKYYYENYMKTNCFIYNNELSTLNHFDSLIIIIKKIELILRNECSFTPKSTLLNRSINPLPFKIPHLFNLYQKFSNLPNSISLYSSNIDILKSVTSAMATILYMNSRSYMDLIEIKNDSNDLPALSRSFESLYLSTLDKLKTFESRILDGRRIKIMHYEISNANNDQEVTYNPNKFLASSQILINEKKLFKCGVNGAFSMYEVLFLGKITLRELKELVISLDNSLDNFDLNWTLSKLSNLIIHLLKISYENTHMNIRFLSTLQLILWILDSFKLEDKSYWIWLKQVVCQFHHEFLQHFYYNCHLSNWSQNQSKSLVASSFILKYYKNNDKNLNNIVSETMKCSRAYSEMNWIRLESAWKSFYIFNFVKNSLSIPMVEIDLKINQIDLIMNYMKPKVIKMDDNTEDTKSKTFNLQHDLNGLEMVKIDWEIILNELANFLIHVSKENKFKWIKLINTFTDKLFKRKNDTYLMKKDEFMTYYSVFNLLNDKKLPVIHNNHPLLFQRFYDALYKLYMYENSNEYDMVTFLNNPSLNLIRSELLIWIYKLKLDLLLPSESMDPSLKYSNRIVLLESMKNHIDIQIKVLKSQKINTPHRRIDYLNHIRNEIQSSINFELSKKIDRPESSPNFHEIYNQLNLFVSQHCSFDRLDHLVSSFLRIINEKSNLLLIQLSETQIQKNLKLYIKTLEKFSIYYPEIIYPIISCIYEIKRGIRLLRTNVQHSTSLTCLMTLQKNFDFKEVAFQVGDSYNIRTYYDTLRRIQKIMEYILDPLISSRINEYIAFILSEESIDAIKSFYIMKNYLISEKEDVFSLDAEGNKTMSSIDKYLRSTKMNNLVLKIQLLILKVTIGFLYHQMSLDSYLSCKTFNSINIILQIFVNTNSLEEQLNLEKEKMKDSILMHKERGHCIESESEIKIKKFNSYFPNYFQEFETILTEGDEFSSIDEKDESNSTNPKDNLDQVVSKIDKIYKLPCNDVYTLCNLHYEIFYSYYTYIQLGNPMKNLSENERLKLKADAYKVSEILAKLLGEDMNYGRLDSILLNSHIHAISEIKKFLTSTWKLNDIKEQSKHSLNINNRTLNTENSIFSSHEEENKSEYIYNFYVNPNPGEVSLLLEPLKQLQGNLEFLLSMEVIGENRVLINLLKITLRLLNTEINKPLMKFITGCEFLIEKAQEWIISQPDRYNINHSLDEISKLVSRWRLMELYHWPKLLDFYEQEYKIKVTKWWFYLYRIILEFRKNLMRVDTMMSEKKEMARQFIDDIQIFLEYSPCGEFIARLKMILAFYYQIKTEILMNKENNSLAENGFNANIMDEFSRTNTKFDLLSFISSLLNNIYGYYAQFISVFNQETLSLKNSIKTKLNEYISICKWDDSSYYRLKKTSNSTHKKLMKYLDEYTESVLDLKFQDVIKRTMSRKVFDIGVLSYNKDISIDDFIFYLNRFELFRNPCKESNMALLNRYKTKFNIKNFNPYIKVIIEKENMNIAENEIPIFNDIRLNILGTSKQVQEFFGILELAFDYNKRSFESIENVIRGINEKQFLENKLNFSLFLSQLKNIGLDYRKISIKSTFKNLPRNLIFNETGEWKNNYYYMLEQFVMDNVILKLEKLSNTKYNVNDKGGKCVCIYSEILEVCKKQDEYYYKSIFTLNHLWSIDKFSNNKLNLNEIKKSYGFGENLLGLSVLQRYMIKRCVDRHFEIEKVINLLYSLVKEEEYVSSFDSDNYTYISDNELFSRQDFLKEALIKQKENLKVFLLLLEDLKDVMRSFLYNESVVTISEIIDLVYKSKILIEKELFDKCLNHKGGEIVNENYLLISFEAFEILNHSEDLIKNSIEKLKMSIPTVYLNSIINYEKNIIENREYGNCKRMDFNFNEEGDELERMLECFISQFENSIHELLLSIQKAYVFLEKKIDIMKLTDGNLDLPLLVNYLSDLANNLNPEKFMSHLFDSIGEFNKYVKSNYSNLPRFESTIYRIRVLMKDFALLLNLWSSWNLLVLHGLSVLSGLSVNLCYVMLNSILNIINECDSQQSNIDENEKNNETSTSYGIGLGEGKGDKNVSNEYSDEEQLLEGDNDVKSENNENEDNEADDASSGNSVCMKNDFKGEIEDDRNTDNENGTEEESIDKEIGDINQSDEELMEEKLRNRDEDGDEDLDRNESSEYKSNKKNGKSKNREMTAKIDDGTTDINDHSEQENENESNLENEDKSEMSIDSYEDNCDGYNNKEFINDDGEDFSLSFDSEKELEIPEDEKMDISDCDSNGSLNDMDSFTEEDGEQLNNEEKKFDDGCESSGSNDEEKCDQIDGDENDGINNQQSSYQDDENNEIEEDNEIPVDPLYKGDRERKEEYKSDKGVYGVQNNFGTSDSRDFDQIMNGVEEQSNSFGGGCGSNNPSLDEKDSDADTMEHMDEEMENFDKSENTKDELKDSRGPKSRKGSILKEFEMENEVINDKSEFKKNNPLNRSLEDVGEYWNKKRLAIEGEEDECKNDLSVNEDENKEVQENEEKHESNGQYEFVNEEDNGHFDDLIMDYALKEQPNENNYMIDDDEFADGKDNNSKKEDPFLEVEEIDSGTFSEKKDSKTKQNEIGGEKMVDVDESNREEVEIDDEVSETLLVSPDDIIDLRYEMQSLISSMKNNPENIRIGGEIWRRLRFITSRPAQLLCEQLRLILEPTMKSRMQGDYKTGKRLNMRRIVTYVASQFKKDLIWLRKTRPSNREYQIILALDDSKSVKLGGADQMMREAMATISIALQKLQVGQFGLIKFGEKTTLLHPVELPFSDEIASMIQINLEFEQNSTNMDNLLSTSIELLKMSKSRVSEDLKVSQLLFIIGDGRFGDQRKRMKYWIQQAQINRIFIVYIILDFFDKNQSILDIQTVKTLSSGGIEISPYIDEFPFLYYIILRNINNLSDTLCSALKQWFEIVTK